jgi:putative ABC transport system permease protein
MDTLFQDFRYAVRTLLKNPSFTLIAVVTLALGIGANTAIFSVIHAALLRPLPYKDVDRLVYVSESNPRDGRRVRQSSYPDYLDWRQASVFDGAAAYTGAAFFAGKEMPERVAAGRVTADFFKVLGVSLAAGRYFSEAEENGEGRPAIISNGFWQRRFAGDPNVLGQSILLNTVSYTIVGVLPSGFHFAPVGAAEIWVPLNPSAVLRERRFTHWLYAVARLKEGVTMTSAQGELNAIAARISALDRQFHADSTIVIGPLAEPIIGRVRPVLIGLFIAVGLVLLIACANVANLMLARSAGRQREMAIRVAVGANRRRLIQQLLTETLLLSAIGGIAGILLSPRLVDVLISRIPAAQLNTMPFLLGSGINASVLMFTTLAVIFTAMLCGLLPALQASSMDIRSAIAPARRALRNGLVVAEIALALVLLVGAGLLLKSMLRLLEVDPGFDAANLTMMQLTLLTDPYREPAQRNTYFDNVVTQLAALPGIKGVTGVDVLPLSGGGNTGIPTLEGTAVPIEFSANVRTIFPDYFDVMGIPFISGRRFAAQDMPAGPPVVVVNEGFATRAFPGQNPLGRRMTFAFTPNRWFEIVGVVADENVTGLDASRNPVIYFAYSQGSPSTMNLLVRSAAAPPAVIGSIRAALSAIDPAVPVSGVRTMDQLIEQSPYAFSRRYPATLIGILAAAALVLASIGVYGVIAYSVTHRTRELAIRISVGAGRADIFRLILKEGSLLGGMGVLVGVVLALGATRFMAAVLFEVTATDVSVYVSVAGVFMAVALLASYVPARRATRVDPLLALRDQ